MQSATPLPRYTILPSHFAPPHLGFTSTILQSSYKRLRWLGGFQLDGEHVPVQLHWRTGYCPLHTGIIPLQLVCTLGKSLPLMESQASRQPLSLGILMMWHLLLFFKMGHHLYLGVMTRPSSSGMCRLVGLSRHSVVTPDRSFVITGDFLPSLFSFFFLQLTIHSFSFLFLSFFKDQNRTQRSHWRYNKATGLSTHHCFHQSQARRLNPLPLSPSRHRSGILERNPLLPTGSPSDCL